MSKKKKSIEEFFTNYESNFNDAISEEQPHVSAEVRRSFADCFVESSPVGVICGKNDDTFANKIKQGFTFYRSIGSKSMNIVSKDITQIDDYHAMVKIYWRYSYLKDNNPGSIDFHNTYFVRIIENDVKIFAYIAGDEQKALKEKGLIHEELVTNQ